MKLCVSFFCFTIKLISINDLYQIWILNQKFFFALLLAQKRLFYYRKVENHVNWPPHLPRDWATSEWWTTGFPPVLDQTRLARPSMVSESALNPPNVAYGKFATVCADNKLVHQAQDWALNTFFSSPVIFS